MRAVKVGAAAVGALAAVVYVGGRLAVGKPWLPALRPVDLTGKTAIVTGGSAGLGKEIARTLMSWNADVILACRDTVKGESVLAELRETTGKKSGEVWKLDLTSFKSVRQFATRFVASGRPLHMLINNAGVVGVAETITEDDFETTYQVNHLAPFLLTHLLLGTLKASAPSRIVNVSSKFHYNGVLDRDLYGPGLRGKQQAARYDELRAYADSKLMNVVFAAELARRLKGTGVTATAVHPGLVTTEMGTANKGMTWTVMDWMKKAFGRNVVEGAKTPLYAAAARETEGMSGVYFDSMGLATPHPAANDPAQGSWLWETSRSLTGLVYPEV